jgi:hypothetical protein
VKLGQQNRDIEKGESENAYKKDIGRLIPLHVRSLDNFDLRDEPVQPVSNLLARSLRY